MIRLNLENGHRLGEFPTVGRAKAAAQKRMVGPIEWDQRSQSRLYGYHRGSLRFCIIIPREKPAEKQESTTP